MAGGSPIPTTEVVGPKGRLIINTKDLDDFKKKGYKEVGASGKRAPKKLTPAPKQEEVVEEEYEEEEDEDENEEVDVPGKKQVKRMNAEKLEALIAELELDVDIEEYSTVKEAKEAVIAEMEDQGYYE